MNRDLLFRRALRGIAVAIALAAVIDPAISSRRTTKPDVVILAVDSVEDRALADRVAKNLENRYTISQTPLAGASGTVVVGNRVPQPSSDLSAPVFAVVANRTGASVSLEQVIAPVHAPSDARVPVVAVVRVTGARGRTLDVTLRSGELAVDHITRAVTTDFQTLRIPLTYVPTAPALVPLRVTASLGDADRASVADVAVDVRDRRWPVLVFDPRPSWMSTFVRRAIERDPRFVVTSRVVTSRNVSSDAGNPPGRLDDLAALALYDAVIVGAPEALSPQDVAGLEAFMRRRGGSVVLLLDQRAPGPYDRLVGDVAWATSTANAPVTIAAPAIDSATLRASDLAWPSQLLGGAESLTTGARPVIWRSSVGAGELVVSGALDAWRFRDPSMSGFDRFWQTLIAESANAAPPPLSVVVAEQLVAPGEPVVVHATVRDAALRPLLMNASNTSNASGARTSVSARIDSGAAIRLWPVGLGEFRGTVRAPSTRGDYRVSVVADGNRAEAHVLVAPSVRRATPSSPELLGTWAGAHAGMWMPEKYLDDLGPMLARVIQPAVRLETWHPMRPAWWLFPFVLALSGEWWLRRRRGLP